MEPVDTVTTVLLLLTSFVLAAEPVQRRPAEYQRLSEEMKRMAKAGNWGAVERSFLRLDAISTEHTFAVLLNSAFSAREMGDVGLAKQRLVAASKLQKDPIVEEWLWSIQDKYVSVFLGSNLADNMRLFPESMPFMPEQRSAVQFAMKTIEEEALFDGLLPKGKYTFRPLTETDGPYVLHFDLSRERQSIDLRSHKHGTASDRRKRRRIDKKAARQP